MINYVIANNKDINNNKIINKWLEDYGVIFLVQSSWEDSYCIYEVNYNEEIEIPKGIDELPNPLYCLLYSSKKSYQPAIALAREELVSYHKILKNSSKELFMGIYYKILKYFLDNQKNYPFLIAQSKTEDFGWMMPNYYYWIVGYNEEENKVYWVSDDYFIYEDSVEEFNIDYRDLLKLKGYPKIALNNEII